jgi:SAM-dependent methyltransferase
MKNNESAPFHPDPTDLTGAPYAWFMRRAWKVRQPTMPRFVVEFGKDGTPPAQDGRLDAPAFHRNQEPIWQALAPFLAAKTGSVLEIGSGTGQHTVTYAARTPCLVWHPSDLMDTHLASIAAWRAQAGLANVAPPQRIDIAEPGWTWTPGGALAAMLCVNVLHISPLAASRNLISGAARHLAGDGRLFVYGPFMRDGAHTAPSNADFDASLRARNAEWGVRDTRDLAAQADANGLALADVLPMPANNFVLVFARRPPLD